MKKDKDGGAFRDPQEWAGLVPDEAKAHFSWPTPQEREEWLRRRYSTPVFVPDPSEQIGAEWDFFRVFEAVEEGEYALVGCEMTDGTTAEMHIDPWSYPYGGLGPFIALAEAFGFRVVGLNEYGEYQSREELLAKPAPGPPPRKPWWRFWE